MRPDEVERLLRERLDALPPAARAELLHVLMLPDFERAARIREGTMPRTISLIFTTYAGMDMGRDNGGVVDLAYEDKAPYEFTGTLKQVVFDLKPAPLTQESELHVHETVQSVGAGAA